MHKIIQITTIILILLSVFCAKISEATALLPGLTLHKEKDSVVVLDVTRGSKTWDVGIRIGDILLKIDDQEIKTLDDYVKKTKSTSSDETVTLIFLRHGEEYVIIKDSNNYHKKNNVIGQNEKIAITGKVQGKQLEAKRHLHETTSKETTIREDNSLNKLKRRMLLFFTHLSSNEIKWLVLVVIIVIVGIGVFKTFDRTLVFFGSYIDLFFSFVPFILFISAMFVFEDKQSNIFMIPSMIGAIVYNFFRAFQYNWHNKFLAFCIGTGRVTLGYLIPILIVFTYVFGGAVKCKGESDEAFQTRSLSAQTLKLAIIGGLLFLLYALVRKPATISNGHITNNLEEKGGFIDMFQTEALGENLSEEDLFDPDSYQADQDTTIKASNILAIPDMRPGLFDVTTEAWLLRISTWGISLILSMQSVALRPLKLFLRGSL